MNLHSPYRRGLEEVAVGVVWTGVDSLAVVDVCWADRTLWETSITLLGFSPPSTYPHTRRVEVPVVT